MWLVTICATDNVNVKWLANRWSGRAKERKRKGRKTWFDLLSLSFELRIVAGLLVWIGGLQPRIALRHHSVSFSFIPYLTLHQSYQLTIYFTPIQSTIHSSSACCQFLSPFNSSVSASSWAHPRLCLSPTTAFQLTVNTHSSQMKSSNCL